MFHLYPGFEKGLPGEDPVIRTDDKGDDYVLEGGQWRKLTVVVDRGGPKMNPKHIQAQKEDKAPLEYLVWSVLEDEARVLKGGAGKYGVRNWRIDEILASTYEGAMMRHLKAWAMGEDLDPDDGKHHLSHLRACCAIVMDADTHNTMIDDRGRQESKGETDDNSIIPAEDGETPTQDAQKSSEGPEESEGAAGLYRCP